MQRPDVEELEFVVKKLNSDVSNLLQFKISRQDTRAAELIEDVRSQVSKARRTCAELQDHLHNKVQNEESGGQNKIRLNDPDSVVYKKNANPRKRKRNDKTEPPVFSNSSFSTDTDNQPKEISIPSSNSESEHQSNSNRDSRNNTNTKANKHNVTSSLSDEEDSEQSKLSFEENAIFTEAGKKKRRKIPPITIKQLLDKGMVSIGDKITYKGHTTQVDQDGFIGEPGTKGYSKSPSPWVTHVSKSSSENKTTRNGWEATVVHENQKIPLYKLRENYITIHNLHNKENDTEVK